MQTNTVKVAFAADHAGWPLRDRLLREIEALGHTVVDCGPAVMEPGDDYPDRSAAVARAIVERRSDRGVLVCGSGVGLCLSRTLIRREA